MHPKNYTVNDVMVILKDAKEKDQPVYVAKGPCGGCDVRHLVIGEPEKLDVQELIGKLEKMNPDDEFDHI
jgi:tRNA/tmRNA/rRNA uracil-C5-methylase (TrmA/RlmC/RlmD family)